MNSNIVIRFRLKAFVRICTFLIVSVGCIWMSNNYNIRRMILSSTSLSSKQLIISSASSKSNSSYTSLTSTTTSSLRVNKTIIHKDDIIIKKNATDQIKKKNDEIIQVDDNKNYSNVTNQIITNSMDSTLHTSTKIIINNNNTPIDVAENNNKKKIQEETDDYAMNVTTITNSTDHTLSVQTNNNTTLLLKNTDNNNVDVTKNNNYTNTKIEKEEKVNNIEYFMNFTTDTNRAIETVEVIYHDLKYRKACASVGEYSILCMTIRYPFPVPLQQTEDPTIRYPKPVDERFYSLDKNNVYVIKQNDWFQCNNNDTNMIVHDDKIIKECLDTMVETVARKRTDKKEPVISMWTRQKRKNKNDIKSEMVTLFHTVGYKEAYDRVYDFFGNDHEIIVIGASPTPNVTEGLRPMLGNRCSPTKVNQNPNYNCDKPINVKQPSPSKKQTNGRYLSNAKYNSHHQRRKVSAINGTNTTSRYLSFTDLEENHVNMGVFDYRLFKHALTGLTVLQALEPVHRKDGWKKLRNFSLVVEYPFAHTQTQEKILDNSEEYHTVQYNQEILPTMFLELNTTSGKKVLAEERGYQFQNLFVFDGIPQYYPSITSGYTYAIANRENKSEYNFSYVGWKADYGNNCRGPLPSNSILREVNLLSRTNFENFGLDMKYYGRTWEFVNLFWFQIKMWSYGYRVGQGMTFAMDCTHPMGYEGLNGIHKYFMQAMIDEYFDE